MRKLDIRHVELTSDARQRKNLVQLSDFLYELDEPNRFDMTTYSNVQIPFRGDHNSDKAVDHYLHALSHDCGTTACGIGWGPKAGISVDLYWTYVESLGQWDIDWDNYANGEFVPIDYGFRWMFSGYWTMSDNSAMGVALRIRYALEHSVPMCQVSQVRRTEEDEFVLTKRGKRKDGEASA